MVKCSKTERFTILKSTINPSPKGAGGAESPKDLSQFEKMKSDYASQEIPKANRVGSGLKDDILHRAASYVSEEQLAKGRVTSFTGGDDKSYTLLQTKGDLNGADGIYEYVMNSGGEITHQKFISGGKITGSPNQIVPKGGY